MRYYNFKLDTLLQNTLLFGMNIFPQPVSTPVKEHRHELMSRVGLEQQQ